VYSMLIVVSLKDFGHSDKEGWGYSV
jgi:hypothetical protein